MIFLFLDMDIVCVMLECEMLVVGDVMVLDVCNLVICFDIKIGLLGWVISWVYVVEDVFFDLWEGEILLFVGELGCGKFMIG